MYQQISDRTQNIEQENNIPDILAATNSDSSNVESIFTNSIATEPQSTLFVPLLGQSNAQHLSIVYDPYQPGSVVNDTSGAIVLDQNLTGLTGSNVVTSDTQETNFAVGGSKVNGNGYYQDDRYVWWYPEQNQPGGALLQAEQGVRQWLVDNQVQPTDEIAIVWSQGESDVGDLSAYNPDSREQYNINISGNPSLGVIQGTDNPDVIVGTLAVDEIVAGGGNDVIIASQGVDTFTGGEGSDIFFYDSLIYPGVAAHHDRIVDFEVGSDRLDISELLIFSGYTGANPVADGYVVVNLLSENSLAIQFDTDGAGEQPGSTLAILENVDPTGFQNDINNQFIFTPTEF
ncbi:MAG: M10 family metallopeptidase C-terminal domain-containing protein [Pleurocapsa sp. MO_192.B19]|nr:M10 family metallopeptidase C-terminal domain-containing protein [Pleurocapsa sp. MO_192.B19]